jgi:alanine racemase
VSELHEPTVSSDELRPTYIEVDLEQLERNYHAIAAYVTPARVMPILKANAYGHGLIEVARRLEHAGAPCLGVAYLEEALRLRQHGVRTNVLVLGGIIGSQLPRFIEHDLSITASSVDKLQAIETCAIALGKRARVHLKIDTGMERIGVHWYSADKLLEASLRMQHVDIEGVFTHFANADEPDFSRARLQLERFEEVLRFYERHALPTPTRHAANSGAILQLPEANLDMVRPGVLSYGVSPAPALVLRGGPLTLGPALRWSTRVVFFKVVKADHPVSYGSTWAPDSWTRVITLPVGYGDGYLRAMSGQAEVLVHGERARVVGRICMDQIMVDIGRGSAWNGDEVVLLGKSGDEQITAEELALWAGTIPHEILTNINTRVPRVYKGKVSIT